MPKEGELGNIPDVSSGHEWSRIIIVQADYFRPYYVLDLATLSLALNLQASLYFRLDGR